MPYVPDRGHAVWINFNPQAGREQAGRRPALVLSSKSYNGKTGLLIACPITNQQKGYPFEVALPDNLDVSGVVLADHIKSLDWRERQADFITEIANEIVKDVLAKLATLIS